MKTVTLTWSDLSALAGITAVITGAAVVYIRLFVGAELLRQEARITEKIKLAFAQKELTELKFKNIEEDVAALKQEKK